MHGDVGAAIEQGIFQFLDEQALAADLGERPVENLVAAGGHAEQFDLAGRIQGFEPRLDVLGLPQGKAGFAGGDDDAAGRWRSRFESHSAVARRLLPTALGLARDIRGRAKILTWGT